MSSHRYSLVLVGATIAANYLARSVIAEPGEHMLRYPSVCGSKAVSGRD